MIGNDVIIYTGEGGRDSATERQIADQQLTLGNRALAENHLNGIPVRVRRGEAHVPNMPEGFGYRYDDPLPRCELLAGNWARRV